MTISRIRSTTAKESEPERNKLSEIMKTATNRAVINQPIGCEGLIPNPVLFELNQTGESDIMTREARDHQSE